MTQHVNAYRIAQSTNNSAIVNAQKYCLRLARKHICIKHEHRLSTPATFYAILHRIYSNAPRAWKFKREGSWKDLLSRSFNHCGLCNGKNVRLISVGSYELLAFDSSWNFQLFHRLFSSRLTILLDYILWMNESSPWLIHGCCVFVWLQ